MKETRGYIDRSLLPTIGDRQLSKLKTAEIDAFYKRLIAAVDLYDVRTIFVMEEMKRTTALPIAAVSR